MKSWRLWSFKKMSEALPEDVQAQATKNFSLWRGNPWHPSLRFKEVSPGVWSIRINRNYRAFAEKHADGTYLWYWIGPHRTYDKLLREQR